MHKYLISNILHTLSIFLRSSGEQARSYQTYNKFWCRFEPLIKTFNDGVLHRHKSSSLDSKLYQVIF